MRMRAQFSLLAFASLALAVAGAAHAQSANQGALAAAQTSGPRNAAQATTTAAPPEGHGLRGGKVTLLDFWATWCGVCREALPGLKKLESSYQSEDFEVVSVSEDENEGAWRDFVARHSMTWTQRLDASHQMFRHYGADALPTYVLIDRDGTVLQTYVGDDPAESISERIGPDVRRILQGQLSAPLQRGAAFGSVGAELLRALSSGATGAVSISL